MYTVQRMKKIVLIAHNIRSTHNVGSLLRTCDGLGITKLYLTGYTPYPVAKEDVRLPHISHKLTSQIHKTALGAEETVDWEYVDSVEALLKKLKSIDYRLIALEQSNNSHSLPQFKIPEKTALLIGEEVNGIGGELLGMCDEAVEIPMFGKKESFNVSVAAAIALYHFRFS